jgi:hypothetical protein
MVLVTAVYAYYTIQLWRTTTKQADAARDQAQLAREQTELTRAIFTATHRPEIAVEPFLKQAANPGHVIVNFNLTNHGRMVAVITVWSARLTLQGATVAEAKDLTGTVAVFPGAQSDAMPSLELKGDAAAKLWNPSLIMSPHTLYLAVSYRGSGAAEYETVVRAAFSVTATRTLRLENIEHEIT